MSDVVKVLVDAGDVHRVLGYLTERLAGLDMGVVGQALVTAVDDKIQAEGAVGGMPRWPQLSDETLARRPGAKMLQRSGLLANVQSRQEGPRSVVVQSPAPYAGFHVTGTFTRGGEVRMPKRDFFEIDMDAALEDAGLRVLERLDF